MNQRTLNNRIKQLRELANDVIATADEIRRVVQEAERRGLTIELFNRVSGALVRTKQGMERMLQETIDLKERASLLTPEWLESYRQLTHAETTLIALRPVHGWN